MGSFSTSFRLTKLAFRVINKEKELLAYSLISGICSILVIISFFMFLFGLSITGSIPTEESSTEFQIFDIVVGFVIYFLLSFITFFFNTAIITSIPKILEGKDHTFGEGIREASKHLGKIATWAFISAFISTLLEQIQKRVPGLGKLVISFLGAAVNIAMYFALPLMILDNRKVGEAIKESPGLFMKGWDTTTLTSVGTSLFFIVLFFGYMLFLIFLTVLLSSLGYFNVAGISMAVLLILGVIMLILFSTTIGSVLKTLLYLNITQGKELDIEDSKVLGEMFKTPK